MEVLKENPFVVLTPDDKGGEKELEITNAEIIHRLFVNVFEDFQSIPQQGHVFLNGPRGSGKSMMFRFLLPDCQLIDKKVNQYNQLPFFSIHVPVKLTSINNPEYELIKDYGNSIFNEHILTLYFAEVIFDSLSKLNFSQIENNTVIDEVKLFYKNSFERRLKLCGWKSNLKEEFNPKNLEDAFVKIKQICSDALVESNQFLKRTLINYINHSGNALSYDGPLCDYLTFLFPLLKEIKSISVFPNKPIFLLVDDADNLTETQTIVLNTWVSYRSNSEVSLKISTQLNYKTYNTINGTNIDSPHDYYDINILTVYSSAKDIYNTRVKQIITKRLEFFFDKSGIDVCKFFPTDKDQDKAIEKIKESIREKYSMEGRGYRENDDVVRYAIPNYIKSLKGTSKSGSTYKYAGFDQLVSISSGIIRHFLTPASKMFNTTFRNIRIKNPSADVSVVNSIPPSVQDDEIREYSNRQLFDEYDKLKKDTKQITNDVKYLDKIEKLRNLIEGLGGLFHKFLLDETRSERKFFSFAISGIPDTELLEVIELGVRSGYFHKSFIGKKNGTGKTRHYILNRVLAPHFLLDPTGYAHYKFFTSDKLKRALYKPDSFIDELSKIKENLEDKESLQSELEF